MKNLLIMFLLFIGNLAFSDEVDSIAQKYVSDIKVALEKTDYGVLRGLLSETFQTKPVLDSLHNTEIGAKYYLLGAYLNELLRSEIWDKLLVLLENGASGFIEDGKSPVVKSYLTKIILEDDSVLLSKFIYAGAAIDVNSYLGNVTPDLVYAVKKNSKNAFKTLLDFGADINRKYIIMHIGEYGLQIKYPIFTVIAKKAFYEIIKHYEVDYNVSEIKTSLTIKDNKEMIMQVTTSLVSVEDGYDISEAVEYLEYKK